MEFFALSIQQLQLFEVYLRNKIKLQKKHRQKHLLTNHPAIQLLFIKPYRLQFTYGWVSPISELAQYTF